MIDAVFYYYNYKVSGFSVQNLTNVKMLILKL